MLNNPGGKHTCLKLPAGHCAASLGSSPPVVGTAKTVRTTEKTERIVDGFILELV
jgi:hypothetical protein